MKLTRLSRVAVLIAIFAACSSRTEPPAGSMQASIAHVPSAPAPVTAAASDAELQRLRGDLRSAQTEVEALKKSKVDLEQQLVKLTTENVHLRRTPQVALSEASAKLGTGTDDGDREAIAAYQKVAVAYPTDPAAAAARTKIEELNKDIAARAKALAKAQAEVRKLIKICRSNTSRAQRVDQQSIHFNELNQMDMNIAMAGSRRSEVLTKAATNAKEKAAELVKTVPDPDGRLAAEIEKCDEVDN